MRALLACCAGVAVLVSACGQVDAGGAGGAGGGDGGSRAGTPKEFDARAASVARTWVSMDASGAWKSGLVPLQDLTVVPPGGFPSDELKQAFLAGVYTSRSPLPDAATTGVVRFADGSTLHVPVIGARAAYAFLDQGDPTCGPQTRLRVPPAPPTAATPDTTAAQPLPPPDQPQPSQSVRSQPGSSGAPAPLTARTPPPPPSDLPLPSLPTPTAPVPGPTEQPADGSTMSPVTPGVCSALQVTKATLATTQIRTSRGLATVPAWQFTVAGMKEPILRVAVGGRAVASLPDPYMPPAPPSETMIGAQTLDSVSGRTLRFTLGVGSCDKNIVARVWESGAVVVVGGDKKPPPPGQVCDAMLRLAPVSVVLDAPLGDRVVLDVVSGRPLVLGTR